MSEPSRPLRVFIQAMVIIVLVLVIVVISDLLVWLIVNIWRAIRI